MQQFIFHFPFSIFHSVRAAIILHRNGDVEIEENDTVTLLPYEIPFAHNGFGQDDDWVRANFTNAAEILSAGYTNWVNGQIGYGLLNGLYRFTAVFPEDPPEATRLFIGDYSVCVTNAGVYTFVLEKGEDYEFGTWPFNGAVDYHIEDDLADSGEGEFSWWGDDSEAQDGEWTIGGGWNWLDFPTAQSVGSCGWMPTLQGSPGVSHLGPDAFPMTFSAILTDCCRTNDVSFQWSTSDENVSIANPAAASTSVDCDSLPSWSTLSMSVEAIVNGCSLWSSVYTTYGTNDTPQVSFIFDAPSALLINSNCVSGAKIKMMALSLCSDYGCDGIVRLSFLSGGQKVVLHLNSKGGPVISLPQTWSVAECCSVNLWIEGVGVSDRIDDICLKSEYIPSVGSPVELIRNLTVVEIGEVAMPGTTSNGLVVVAGDAVSFAVECMPTNSGSLLSTLWEIRKRKKDGTWYDWTQSAFNYHGATADYNTTTGGIYQVRVIVGVDNEAVETREYHWLENDDPDISIREKGSFRAFGVVSELWQKNLWECAVRHLGSLAYLSTAALPAQFGYPGYPAGDLEFKCNIFVAHRIVESGLPAVKTRGFLHNRYPPLANDWGNVSYNVPNWDVFIGDPEPGVVVAEPSGDPEISGHVGIMDYDGYGVSAGMLNVNRKFEACTSDIVIRRYANEN